MHWLTALYCLCLLCYLLKQQKNWSSALWKLIIPLPYCYSHNRARQSFVTLLSFLLFRLVISQDLHFFGRNNFHESMCEALCQEAATIQCSVAVLLQHSSDFIWEAAIWSTLFVFWEIFESHFSWQVFFWVSESFSVTPDSVSPDVTVGNAT